MRNFRLIVERCPETGLYVGYVPDLPGVHSQANTVDELNHNMLEVIELFIEAEKQDQWQSSASSQ